MKKLSLLLIILSFGIVAFAQKQEERKLDNFNSVSVGIPANVYITKGNTFKVVLKGDADDLEEIETDVDGDRLELKTRDEFFSWGNVFDEKIEVYITMPQLTGIRLAGSGKIICEDKFTTDSFEANIAGSGRIEVQIEARDTDINISGSGKIFIKGSTQEADINISGSGDVEAEDFKIADCEIKVMGSGNTTVYVADKLETKIMGSGDVRYKGNPKHVNNNSMGSGSVRKI